MSPRGLAEKLHTRPFLALGAALVLTALAAWHVTPLKYDFSFTSLFVGEGDEYDTLHDYLSRFGTDVNVVVVTFESDELFSADVMNELRSLTARIESLEGVESVVSPTNVTDLVGDGGRIASKPVIPDAAPGVEIDWVNVRQTATTHPLLAGSVFSADGRHAALVARFGLESDPAHCDDGVDNDASGGIDCLDPGCWTDSARGICEGHVRESTSAACTNGVDDDGDRLIDCLDPDCATLRACSYLDSSERGELACQNGVDDDGDGTIDCADFDCIADPDVQSCDTTDAIIDLIGSLDARARAEGWGQFALGGVPIVSKEYTRVIQHDLKTYLPLTAALVGVVLLVLFRSVRGVLLPLAVVGISVLWALGAMMGTGGKLNMINSSMPTLLLVIAIADAVHLISRHLEESERTSNSGEATARTMRQMAVACLLTSVTSAVGFGTLMSAHLPIIRSFGAYTALGIMLSYAAAMLILPSILARLPLPDERERARARHGEALARHVTRLCSTLVFERPRLAWALVAAVTIPALAGALRIESDQRLLQEVRADNPVAIANAIIEEHHGGVLAGAIVFRGAPGALADPEVLRELADLGEFAERWRWEGEDQLVTTTLSLADIVMEAHAAYQGSESARTVPASRAGVVALLDQIPVSDRESVTSADYSVAHVTMRMVTLGSNAWSALRQELEAEIAARPALDALDWTFTGSSTLGQDAMRFMTRDLLTSLGLAVVIIMILMSFLFRSVRVGVLSMVPNVFPMLVTAGVVGGLGIDIRVSTAVVFSISLGIAVDDTIHVLVRFREELGRRAGDYEEALRRAIDGAGRPVVFTTVMLCAGFATLSMSEFNAVRELGMLGAVTLVSALVGDLILLPLVLLSWRPRVR